MSRQWSHPRTTFLEVVPPFSRTVCLFALTKRSPPGAVEALRHCTCTMRQFEDIDVLADRLSQEVAGCIADMAAIKLMLDYIAPMTWYVHALPAGLSVWPASTAQNSHKDTFCCSSEHACFTAQVHVEVLRLWGYAARCCRESRDGTRCYRQLRVQCDEPVVCMFFETQHGL